MNLFSWRKSVNISKQDPSFKVRYLGNVQTMLMKGDGCVDRPTNAIWNNYLRSENASIDMTLVVASSGMKAYTKEQGLTEYRAHRISYCIAHPSYPRVFVWVYRHEGRKMKMEVRCHAVMCKNASTARTIALQLHQKLSLSLKEFQREKIRKQNYRITLQRTQMLASTPNALPLRAILLSTAKNFRPPVCKSQTAPKLGCITEDEEEDFDEEEVVRIMQLRRMKRGSVGGRVEGNVGREDRLSPTSPSLSPTSDCSSLSDIDGPHHILEALDLNSTTRFHTDYLIRRPLIDLEIGNDLDELRRDDGVQFCLSRSQDSDEESAESGYHDHEPDSISEVNQGKVRKEEVTTTEDEGFSDGVCLLPSISTEFCVNANT